MANDFSGSNYCALWKFDNNANDSHADANDLTEVNTPSYDAGDKQEGTHSISFARASTELAYRTDANLAAGFPGKNGSGVQDFSICFWMKLDSLPSSGIRNYGLVSKYSGSYLIHCSTAADKITFITIGDAAKIVTFGTACATGIWYHVAVTFVTSTGAMKIRIWDDNASALLDSNATGTLTTAWKQSTALFEVGRYGSNSLYCHDGHVDELAVFAGEALSDADIDKIRAGTYGAAGGYTLIADSGSYSKTGQVAGLLADRKLSIGSGSFNAIGTIAGLLRDYHLGVEAGSLSIAGQNVELIKDSRIPVESGSLAVTGQNVALLKDSLVPINSGSFALSGQGVSLLKDSIIPIGVGTYDITGQNAALLRGLKIGIENGAYALTGSDVTLTYTPLGGYTLIADGGTYNLTGMAANLLHGYRLGVETGSLILSGQDVSLLKDSKLLAEPSSYSITGQTAALLRDLLLSADSGSYDYLSGQAVSLLKGFVLGLEAGGYSLTGQGVAFLRNFVLNAESGTLDLTGQDVDLIYSGVSVLEGCLKMIFSSTAPNIEFDSKQPSITFKDRCN